jgi:hypothetical protein
MGSCRSEKGVLVILSYTVGELLGWCQTAYHLKADISGFHLILLPALSSENWLVFLAAKVE